MGEVKYLLYKLEDEAEGCRRFKLACPDALHHLIQNALPLEVYCRIPDADGVNLHRITYYTAPEHAETVYENVKLILQDYYAGIQLDSAWWDFIENGI